MATPVRTCIGCGATAPRDGLVRLRLRGGEVTVDRASSGGRGAWLHAGEACLRRAVKRRAFGRAFRVPDAQIGEGLLRELLTGSARKD